MPQSQVVPLVVAGVVALAIAAFVLRSSLRLSVLILLSSLVLMLPRTPPALLSFILTLRLFFRWRNANKLIYLSPLLGYFFSVLVIFLMPIDVAVVRPPHPAL